MMMAIRLSPGSLGLMLQPYWSPGLKVPRPEAKDAITGYSIKGLHDSAGEVHEPPLHF
jgi:hypothetical protein